MAYVAPAPDQEIVKSHFKMNAHLEGAVAAAYVGERISIDEEGERLTREGNVAAYANAARRGVNFASMVNYSPGGASFNEEDGYIFNWRRARLDSLADSYDRLVLPAWFRRERNGQLPGIYRRADLLRVENTTLLRRRHRIRPGSAGCGALPGIRRGPHYVLPDLDCYDQGERQVATTVENDQPSVRHSSVDFELIPSGTKSPVFANASS